MMKMYPVILSFLVFQVTNSFGQTNEYKLLAQTADSLFLKGNYSQAIKTYNSAFVANGDVATVGHRYKAASCYAKLDLVDSAFIQLTRIATKGKFTQVELLANDANFQNLHSDNRWDKILQIVDDNRRNKLP